MKPREDLRIAGVEEQVERAKLLFEEARAAPTFADAFRKLIAAVYPARAAVELMRESAKRGELVVSLGEFDRRLSELVPRHRLIWAVRIRDFHRYGVVGGGRMVVESQITLPPHCEAEFSMYPDPANPRPVINLSDPSGSYKFLLTSDVVVQDETEPEAISYWTLLGDYLEQLPKAIARYCSLLRRPDG